MLGVDPARKAKLEQEIKEATRQKQDAEDKSKQSRGKSKSEQEKLAKAAKDAAKRLSELEQDLQELLGTYKAAPNQTKNEGMVQARNASIQQQNTNEIIRF